MGKGYWKWIWPPDKSVEEVKHRGCGKYADHSWNGHPMRNKCHVLNICVISFTTKTRATYIPYHRGRFSKNYTNKKYKHDFKQYGVNGKDQVYIRRRKKIIWLEYTRIPNKLITQEIIK